MGLSGKNGKVYLLDASCPTPTGSGCEMDWSLPAGTPGCITDEVTKFNTVDSVQMKKYGHDKSYGWQDSVAGTRGMTITLEANISEANTDGHGGDSRMWAGKVVYLLLYPAGSACGTSAAGYATVEQLSYTYDMESGLPISYTATVSSKGPWTGVTEVGGEWGGFECGCGE